MESTESSMGEVAQVLDCGIDGFAIAAECLRVETWTWELCTDMT